MKEKRWDVCVYVCVCKCEREKQCFTNAHASQVLTLEDSPLQSCVVRILYNWMKGVWEWVTSISETDESFTLFLLLVHPTQHNNDAPPYTHTTWTWLTPRHDYTHCSILDDDSFFRPRWTLWSWRSMLVENRWNDRFWWWPLVMMMIVRVVSIFPRCCFRHYHGFWCCHSFFRVRLIICEVT